MRLLKIDTYSNYEVLICTRDNYLEVIQDLIGCSFIDFFSVNAFPGVRCAVDDNGLSKTLRYNRIASLLYNGMSESIKGNVVLFYSDPFIVSDFDHFCSTDYIFSILNSLGGSLKMVYKRWFQ